MSEEKPKSTGCKRSSRKAAKRPTPKTPPSGSNSPESGDTGEVVDLEAFLLELSARLVTAGTVPLPQAQPAPVEPEARIQIIVFQMRGVLYGVDLHTVSEVIRDPEITRVPGLPDWVLGVTNLHGEITSVVDLSRFLDLGSPGSRRSSHMIVAQAADQRIGLMVDDVELIYSFPLEQVLSPPFKVEPGIVPYLRGAVERDQEFIRLLDGERLLLGQQMQQFS